MSRPCGPHRQGCRGPRLGACGAVAVAYALLLGFKPAAFTQSCGRNCPIPRRPDRSATAMSATFEELAAVRQGALPYGQMSPKLRSLLGSPEYSYTLDKFTEMKSKGLLKPFLDTVQAYWKGFDYGNSLEERPNMVVAIRRDWDKLWPKEMPGDGKEEFTAFSGLYKRIGQSGLFAEGMRGVLPQTTYTSDVAVGKDREFLQKLEPEERVEELLRRLEQESALLKQYQKVAAEDEKTSALADDVLPFVGNMMSILESKYMSSQIEVGFSNNVLVVAVAVIVPYFFLVFLGLVQSPFADPADLALPAASTPSDLGAMPALPSRIAEQ